MSKTTAKRSTTRTPKASANGDNRKTPIVTLPTGDLRPNDYNPNKMTDEEFAELVAEVRHLGRLPKPVIVRRQDDGHVIVDGEHGWRAAKEVGLPEVPCELIDGDDFEAMRQTYKRNQHGTHDPLLLGRMFRRMMETRSLSLRDMAKEIGVSEGTVRNAVLYAEAADLRNSYAPDTVWRVAELTVRQVRYYTHLPRLVGNLWFDSGADIKALFETRSEDQVEQMTQYGTVDLRFEDYRQLEETGLFQFIRRVHSTGGFVDAVKKVKAWCAWERTWLRYGIERETLRGYSRHYFEGNFFVRTADFMDHAIGEILEDGDPPAFLLSHEEFAEVLATMKSLGRQSTSDFMVQLRLVVTGKIGRAPENGWNRKLQLISKHLEMAPDFIRESALPPEHKFALWRAGVSEEDKREIAKLERLPLEKGEESREADGYDDCIRRCSHQRKKRQEIQAEWDARSEQQLASELASSFRIYDKEKDAQEIEILAGKLAGLTRMELYYLYRVAKEMLYTDGLAAQIRALHAAVK
jgi:ParB/RepB/Spo0J family partition protein